MKTVGIFLLTLIALSSSAQKFVTKIKWPVTKISVCWEESASSYDQEREWVKAAINRTWEAYSGLEFLNWCPCTKNMHGIHIGIEDSKDGARVKDLGARIDRMSNGMLLNFALKNWGADVREQLKSRKSAIEVIAIHEFGHALGFTHQQVRQGCDLCAKTSQYFSLIPNDGESYDDREGLWLTDCDQYSVMNYCSIEYGNNGKLSETDKSAVSFVYGPAKQKEKPSDLFIKYSASPIRKIEQYEDKSTNPIQQKAYYYDVEKYRYFDVILEISGAPDLLADISKVEYFLDMTFEKANYTVKDAKSNFSFNFAVWGEFTIKANVYSRTDKSVIPLEVVLEKIPPFKIVRIQSVSGATEDNYRRIKVSERP